MSPGLNHFGGQRDIACDHKVSRFESFQDFVISDIKSGFDAHRLDVAGRGSMDILVRNQGHQYLGAFRCAEQNVLNDGRAGIGINPNFQDGAPVRLSFSRDKLLPWALSDNEPFLGRSVMRILMLFN